ncbi:MAG: AAA domain-containing protein [Cellulosilyticaceae bacterium]
MVNNKIDKVTNLYKFLRAYHQMKTPVVTNQADREWLETLRIWPKHPCIGEKWQNGEMGKVICIIKKPTAAMLQKKDSSIQVEAIYNKLYSVYTRLNKEPELLELVYGNGQLQVSGGESIDHPLLMQVVHLAFDPEEEAFALVLTDKMPELYESLLGAMEEVPEDVIVAATRLFENEPISPLSQSQVEAFCVKVSQQFKEDLSVLLMPHHPTLFLRKKQLGYQVAIEGILEDLHKRKQVPPFIADIVGLGDDVRKNQSGKEAIKKLALDVNGIDQKILFTKPANKEQLLVAKHLERNEAVLVQGPPGTGKTHTIANMIGHLLAEGKRILVTSYSEKALAVVKDQVIPELQTLCISLTKDAESRKELEGTLEGIHHIRGSLERSELSRRVAMHEKNREACMRSLEKLHSELKNNKLIEYTPIKVAGKTYKPLEAAHYIHQNREQCEWLMGPVRHGSSLPLEEDEIKALYHMKETLTREDQLICALDMGLEDVLRPNQLEAYLEAGRIFDAMKKPDWLGYFKKEDSLYESNQLKEIIGKMNLIKEQVHLEAPWCMAVLEAGREEKAREQWQTLAMQIKEVYQLSLTYADEMMAYEPKILPIDDKIKPLDLYSQINQKLQSGGKLSKIMLLLNPQIKTLIQASRVNNKEPETMQEFEVLIHYMVLKEQREALRARWERQMVPLGAPSVTKMEEPFEATCQKYGEAILKHLDWYKRKWLPIAKELEGYGVDVEGIMAKQDFTQRQEGPVHYLYHDVLDEVVEVLTYQIAKCEKDKAASQKEQFEKDLSTKDSLKESEILTGLLEGIQTKDLALYEQSYNAFEEARLKMKHLNRQKDLIEKLAFAAPGWAAYLEAIREEDEVMSEPHHIQEAWLWRQLVEILGKRHERTEMMIKEEIQEVERRLHYHTKQLVCDKAWLHKLVDFDANRSEIQAIEGWKQLIVKMGAGKGKQAELLKKEARKLMPKCQKAVPVWIMPLDKVADHFDPRENKFDVVIIDEASQADVTALIALYLGKQVLIVGDDEQVSPLAVGENAEEIQRLIKTYLEAVPNHYLYSGRFSIYDLAQLSGYQPVRLREHFRCVPELIGYSNQLAYKGQIEPLRESDKVLAPSLVTCYLPEGCEEGQINTVEAEEIVRRILACCQDEKYTHKTFGVISLKGDKQAAYIDSLLQKEMTASAYEKRKILCGGPAHFQGDERDIIFISMVDAKNDKDTLRLMTYGTDNLYKKRYNVAMSRARDQVFVMHSFDPQIDLKEEDIRYELFEYCLNVGKEQRLGNQYFEEPLVPFEQEIKEALEARGFTIRSHGVLGNCLTGLIIEGPNRQIRLVCESEKYHEGTALEEEMGRLAVLERVGWEILYISASWYYQNPEEVLEQLIMQIHQKS